MAVLTNRLGLSSSTTVNSISTRAASEDIPPLPTSNKLDAAQRSRYIRSARKLGKVLGATPLIMESVSTLPSLTPSVSRASHTFSAPSTPSTSQVELSAGTAARKSMESESRSSHMNHSEYDAGTDVLSPLPVFPDSSSRNRLSFHQPILRLPLFNRMTRASMDSTLVKADETPTADNDDSETQVVSCDSQPPASPSTPSSASMPSTPSNDVMKNHLSDDLDFYAYADDEDDERETRLRKRRMDKLTRHLGECIPSELVSGSTRSRTSISGPTRSASEPLPIESAPSTLTPAQAKMTRRVSVVSVVRKRSVAEGYDSGSGYRSGSDMSERMVRDTARHIVEDDWTPEAYEDVVKRLRRLK